MITEVIKTTFQFKRGLSSAWEKTNPILSPGEPGWALDTHVLKIGDGATPWNELPSSTNSGVFNAATHFDFPAIGFSNIIYKAEDEAILYQWNSNKLIYEALNATDVTIQNIEIINGGNAYGTT